MSAGEASGWTCVETADGSLYYQNRAAKLTSWERPADVPAGVQIPLYHKKFTGNVDAVEGGSASATATSPGAEKKTPWVKVLAEDSGKYYYMNRKTKTTTWDRPDTGGIPIPMWQATFQAPVPVALRPAPGVALPLASGRSTAPAGARRPEFHRRAAREPLWQEVVEQGHTFYRNRQTGETAYDRPAVDVAGGDGGGGGDDGGHAARQHPRRAAEFGVVLDGGSDDVVLPLADALARVGLQSPAAAREKAAFAADGSHEDAAFRRLGALCELLSFPGCARPFAARVFAFLFALSVCLFFVASLVRSSTGQRRGVGGCSCRWR
jgi:hypothetical protein